MSTRKDKEQRQREKRTYTIIGGLSLAVLALLVAIGVLVFSRNNSSTSEKETVVESSEPVKYEACDVFDPQSLESIFGQTVTADSGGGVRYDTADLNSQDPEERILEKSQCFYSIGDELTIDVEVDLYPKSDDAMAMLNETLKTEGTTGIDGISNSYALVDKNDETKVVYYELGAVRFDTLSVITVQGGEGYQEKAHKFLQQGLAKIK